MSNISLKVKLAGAVALLLAFMAIVLAVYFGVTGYQSSSRWAERRAEGIVGVLAAAVAPGFESNDADATSESLGLLTTAPGALYAMVVYEGGDVFALWNPLKLSDIRRRNGVSVRVDEDERGMHVVAPISKPSAAGLVLVKNMSNDKSASLVIGFSIDELHQERLADIFWAGLISSLVVVIGVVLSILLGVVLVRPISALTDVTAYIVKTGDLTRSIEVTSRDETGLLAENFSAMVQRLRGILVSVHRLVDGLGQAIEPLSRVGTVVSDGARTIKAQVADTSVSLERMSLSLAAVGENVLALQKTAEDGADVIVTMSSTNDEVASNVAAVATSVLGTTEAVDSMSSSVQKITQHIDELNTAIGQTSTSASEVESSIGRIEESANKTAELTGQVVVQAGEGVHSQEKTRDGLSRIQSAWEEAGKAMGQLGVRIGDVGGILNVIEDITNKTNLLALNASIIASQAGEHGRGFGVVAHEIRSLADRTRASTSEIADMIAGIQRDSQKVTKTLRQGVTIAAQGVNLGIETESVLNSIHHSSGEATTWGQHIASATMEQTRGISQIATAVQHIAMMIERVNNASIQQSQGANLVSESSQNVRQLIQKVQISSQDQSQKSRQMVSSIDDIRVMVQHVATSQTEQSTSAQQVVAAMKAIDGVSQRQESSVGQIETTIAMLQQQTDDLATEVSKFKV